MRKVAGGCGGMCVSVSVSPLQSELFLTCAERERKEEGERSSGGGGGSSSEMFFMWKLRLDLTTTKKKERKEKGEGVVGSLSPAATRRGLIPSHGGGRTQATKKLSSG